MTIRLPKDVEISLDSAVKSGRFASAEDALAQAWRCFLGEQSPPRNEQRANESHGDPLLGSMREYGDEMDEIVADAMKLRRAEPWRVFPGE